MSMRIVHSAFSSGSQRYYNYLYSFCLCLWPTAYQWDCSAANHLNDC